jgi:hypothetical protein
MHLNCVLQDQEPARRWIRVPGGSGVKIQREIDLLVNSQQQL